MPQDILVPVDDSAPARRALNFAFEQYPDSNFSVLHVINIYDGANPYGYPVEQAVEMREEYAESLLSAVADIAENHGTEAETEYVQGQTVDRITDYVEQNDIDIVVLGSHGRSGIRRFLLGSVAEEVVRRVHVPVTVVSAEKEDSLLD